LLLLYLIKVVFVNRGGVFVVFPFWSFRWLDFV